MLVTEDNFSVAMTCLQGANEIGVDSETTGFDVRYGTDYLMGLCFSVEGFDCYMPFRHPGQNLPMRLLGTVESLLQVKDLIWHNRKFDMHSVKTIGIDPLKFTGKQYDTMIIASLIDEELWSKELDALSKKFLNDEKSSGDIIKKLGEIYGWKNIPADVMGPYGEHDAQLTRRLKNRLWPELVSQELESVYWETEAPFTALLYKLEQRGVGTNLDFVENKERIGSGRMATIARELGYNPASPIDLGKHLLTELDLPVLAHTKSCEPCKKGFAVHTHQGKPSFNKIVMEEYDEILEASSNPTARRIAEYRGWQKAVTSLYRPILERNVNGIIKTSFKQHRTVTGRLSASEPNLQQVPRNSIKPWNGTAKRSFTSGQDGALLYGWDYAQLELRLAAGYGMEALLLTEFKQEKADPFSVLSPRIFGSLTPEFRHDTKTFVYANLYGAGLRKIAAQLGRTVEETEPLYKNYHNSIPGILSVSRQVTQLCEQRGWIKYWDGRRRHIRNRSDAYKAWNSLLQGGGAQLVKKAMLRCEEIEDINCQMVLQVHDEITFVIDEGMIPKYEPMIKEAMTDWSHLPGKPFEMINFEVEGKEWK
jgi:DNA polymerase I